MEYIKLKEIFSYLLQKIWLVLIILILVVAGGEFYSTQMKTPLYASNTNVVLISDSASKSEITANDITLSNNLVKTYSEIIKGRNVLSKVISNLDLDISYEQLAGKVTASSITSTQLIAIRVSDKDPKTAQEIANEIGKVFKDEIKNIYGFNNVQIVDEAVEATVAYNIDLTKETVLYVIIGLILGFSTVGLLYALDKTIKDTNTVEYKIGLTVIGVVPKVGEK